MEEQNEKINGDQQACEEIRGEKRGNACKIKLLKIYDILRAETDEDHPMSSVELMRRLGELGIPCDRRTLYSDIKVLNLYGYEILTENGRGGPNRYAIADHGFDLPELRILMDALEAATFLTPKKTRQLQGKIADLAGKHRADLLKHKVLWNSAAKHSNEQIFYAVSEIEQAIDLGQKISFYYFDYDAAGKRVFRHDKRRYVENPLATLFSQDNYYLIAYNEKHQKIIHYRIDRMQQVSVEDTRRVSPPRGMSLAEHRRQLFGMYAGDTLDVTFEVTDNLIDAMMDKFGEKLHFERAENGRLTFAAKVQISPQFLAWCVGFGTQLRILSPDAAITAMREHLAAVSSLYQNP